MVTRHAAWTVASRVDRSVVAGAVLELVLGRGVRSDLRLGESVSVAARPTVYGVARHVLPHVAGVWEWVAAARSTLGRAPRFSSPLSSCLCV